MLYEAFGGAEVGHLQHVAAGTPERLPVAGIRLAAALPPLRRHGNSMGTVANSS